MLFFAKGELFLSFCKKARFKKSKKLVGVQKFRFIQSWPQSMACRSPKEDDFIDSLVNQEEYHPAIDDELINDAVYDLPQLQQPSTHFADRAQLGDLVRNASGAIGSIYRIEKSDITVAWPNVTLTVESLADCVIIDRHMMVGDLVKDVESTSSSNPSTVDRYGQIVAVQTYADIAMVHGPPIVHRLVNMNTTSDHVEPATRFVGRDVTIDGWIGQITQVDYAIEILVSNMHTKQDRFVTRAMLRTDVRLGLLLGEHVALQNLPGYIVSIQSPMDHQLPLHGTIVKLEPTTAHIRWVVGSGNPPPEPQLPWHAFDFVETRLCADVVRGDVVWINSGDYETLPEEICAQLDKTPYECPQITSIPSAVKLEDIPHSAKRLGWIIRTRRFARVLWSDGLITKQMPVLALKRVVSHLSCFLPTYPVQHMVYPQMVGVIRRLYPSRAVATVIWKPTAIAKSAVEHNVSIYLLKPCTARTYGQTVVSVDDPTLVGVIQSDGTLRSDRQVAWSRFRGELETVSVHQIYSLPRYVTESRPSLMLLPNVLEHPTEMAPLSGGMACLPDSKSLFVELNNSPVVVCRGKFPIKLHTTHVGRSASKAFCNLICDQLMQFTNRSDMSRIRVIAYRSALYSLRIVIAGQANTPNALSWQSFDVHLPVNYPQEPPIVRRSISVWYSVKHFYYETEGDIRLPLLDENSPGFWLPESSNLITLALALQQVVDIFPQLYCTPDTGFAVQTARTFHVNEQVVIQHLRGMIRLFNAYKSKDGPLYHLGRLYLKQSTRLIDSLTNATEGTDLSCVGLSQPPSYGMITALQQYMPQLQNIIHGESPFQLGSLRE